MSSSTRVIAFLLLLVSASAATARGEVLVRWSLDHVPSRDSLGEVALLIPAANRAAVEEALALKHTVYVELETPSVPAALRVDRLAGVVVPPSASAEELQALRTRLPGARVRTTDERGKWPHVRLNWVTLRNDVLSVASRTEQPWLENNGALVRIAAAARSGTPPLLRYHWQPITISDMHEGPATDNYLVAIAEAGTFGGHLVLPLHEGFQRHLLMGRPEARARWEEIRRYLAFYSWDLPRRYEPIANIAVVTAEPMRDFAMLNLLIRHNLPFELLTPGQLAAREAARLDEHDLVILMDRPEGPQLELVQAFASRGGTVVLTAAAAPAGADVSLRGASEIQREDGGQVSYTVGQGRVVEMREPIADPNVFALQVRELLGPERRPLDIWNGITVLAVPYADPQEQTVMLTLLNYAHEPLPVQLRVRGTFSLVHYETPGEAPVLLPFRQRDGFTEFVLPPLRVGGRVFLSHDAAFD
jgi:hypothetical protein